MRYQPRFWWGGRSPRAVYFSFKCFLLKSSPLFPANNSAPEGFVRMLLVEDQSDAADVLAKGLREQSYAVDITADGEAALYQASINDYDLVVLDVMLPLRNGTASLAIKPRYRTDR